MPISLVLTIEFVEAGDVEHVVVLASDRQKRFFTDRTACGGLKTPEIRGVESDALGR